MMIYIAYKCVKKMLFPFLFPRNWFKGADTVCILAFLDSRIEVALGNMAGSTKQYFHDIWSMIRAANSFMSCIYNGALWLSAGERDHLLKSGGILVNLYPKCAQRAFDMKHTRWKFMPKFHLFGEILFRYEKEKRSNLPSMNVLAFCTQQDEDFVGRVSVMSRNVSVRTVHSRTLGRYLVSLASQW